MVDVIRRAFTRVILISLKAPAFLRVYRHARSTSNWKATEVLSRIGGVARRFVVRGEHQ